VLHPFMPFLTEDIWQYISERTPEEALIVSKWPVQTSFDKTLIAEFDFASEVVSGIRTIRKEKNIAFKDAIQFSVINNENISKTFDEVIIKLGNLEAINNVSETVEGALTFRVKSNEYFIPIVGAIDVEAEIKKLTEELNYTQGFLKSVQKKLSNERFVAGAPEQVIANERNKEADALAKIETLKASLASLN
jgi:valyl-tRNA synthetase